MNDTNESEDQSVTMRKSKRTKQLPKYLNRYEIDYSENKDIILYAALCVV